MVTAIKQCFVCLTKYISPINDSPFPGTSNASPQVFSNRVLPSLFFNHFSFAVNAIKGSPFHSLNQKGWQPMTQKLDLVHCWNMSNPQLMLKL